MKQILLSVIAPLTSAFGGALIGVLLVNWIVRQKKTNPKNQMQHGLCMSRCHKFIHLSFSIILAIGFVLGVSIIAIKLCSIFAYSHVEQEMIVNAIPLLEKIVWPLFLLIVVIRFEDELAMAFKEIPGLINRSYLPYSPPPYSQATPTKENDITNNMKTAKHKDDKLSETSTHDNTKVFNQVEHEQIVAKIFKALSQEENVQITPNVKILNSPWVCNGACIIGQVARYIVVLPQIYFGRVPSIIERMNEAVKSWNGARKIPAPVLMICLYGYESREEIEKIDITSIRNEANHNVVFRFFVK